MLRGLRSSAKVGAMRVVDVLRWVLLLAVFAAAFAVWLGRVGVAVGGGGLAAVIVFAAFRGAAALQERAFRMRRGRGGEVEGRAGGETGGSASRAPSSDRLPTSAAR